jgi:hypothetical protein
MAGISLESIGNQVQHDHNVCAMLQRRFVTGF